MSPVHLPSYYDKKCIYMLLPLFRPLVWIYAQCPYALAFATGCHALYLFFVVLYGLYADLLMDKTGLCSFGSHARAPCERIGSAVGALSTMYEIHACLNVYG